MHEDEDLHEDEELRFLDSLLCSFGYARVMAQLRGCVPMIHSEHAYR